MGLLSVSTAVLVSAFVVSGNLLRQEARGLVVRRLGITDESFESNVLLQAFLSESRLSKTSEGYPNKCLSEDCQSQPLLTIEDKESTEASPTDQWQALDSDIGQNDLLTTCSSPIEELSISEAPLSQINDNVESYVSDDDDDVTLVARALWPPLAERKGVSKSPPQKPLSPGMSGLSFPELHSSQVLGQDIDFRMRELTSMNRTAHSSSLLHFKDQVYGHIHQKRSFLLRRAPTMSRQGSTSPLSSQAENDLRQYSGQRSDMGSVSAPVSRTGSPNRPRLATGPQPLQQQQQQPIPGFPPMARMQSLPSEGQSFHNTRPQFPFQRTNTLQFLVDLAQSDRPPGTYLHIRILGLVSHIHQFRTMSLSEADSQLPSTFCITLN